MVWEFVTIRPRLFRYDSCMMRRLLRLGRYGLMGFIAYGIIYQFPC
jgi:hypothetical protein